MIVNSKHQYAFFFAFGLLNLLRRFPPTNRLAHWHACMAAGISPHTHTHPPSLYRFHLLVAHLTALYVNQRNPFRTSNPWNVLSVLSRSMLTIAVQNNKKNSLLAPHSVFPVCLTPQDLSSFACINLKNAYKNVSILSVLCFFHTY